MRHAIDRDLPFFHRFEKRALRLRCRAIDFINHDDLGEERPWMEDEALLVAMEHGAANHIAGKQVARELNPPKLQARRARQRMRERGLTHSGNVFDEQMAAREKASY